MADILSPVVERLRTSDPSACEELFDQLHAPLLRYAGRLNGDPDAAYDVVQDAFVRLWERRETMDPEKSVRSLLYRMVRNMTIDELRTARRHRAAMDAVVRPTASPSAESDVDARELRDKLTRWISEMPNRRREAFELSRFEGLSHKEIGEVMGLAPRTVTNHVMTALETLRARLEGYRAQVDPAVGNVPSATGDRP